MPSTSFFPRRPDIHPIIYAYRDKNPENKGLLKIGDTTRTAEIRVAEQFPVLQPCDGKPYEIVFNESAMRILPHVRAARQPQRAQVSVERQNALR